MDGAGNKALWFVFGSLWLTTAGSGSKPGTDQEGQGRIHRKRIT